jgi:hypothetical protein
MDATVEIVRLLTSFIGQRREGRWCRGGETVSESGVLQCFHCREKRGRVGMWFPHGRVIGGCSSTVACGGGRQSKSDDVWIDPM